MDSIEAPITVRDFIEHAPSALRIEVLIGEESMVTRRITGARIQKLGLALAGFRHYIHSGRVQIVGSSEIQYLEQLAPDARCEAIANLELEKIACVLITKNLTPPVELVEAAMQAHMPLVRTPLISSVAIGIISDCLQELLAPREVRHGVLLDLYGLGVLIEGHSGIGKSECALDLITRGHRFVTDDAVEVRRIAPDRLVGSAPELLRGLMEIRGLGILNIQDLFGVSAVSDAKPISLVVKLERWDESEIDRLGLDAETIELLGVPVPLIRLPVSPGRNLATLVETAVRVHLLRVRGYDAAHTFVARHTRMLEQSADEA